MEKMKIKERVNWPVTILHFTWSDYGCFSTVYDNRNCTEEAF